MSRKALPALTLEQMVGQYPAYRQSLLGQLDNCALSARFNLETFPFTTAAQARGIIGHRFAGKLLVTLRATGQTIIPPGEALELLYAACRQEDIPPEDVVIVPMRERRLLRIGALMLAEQPMDLTKLIGVERRLEADIEYVREDGTKVTRTISGQPDALVADPPDGSVVLDWKFALAAPPKGEQPHVEGDHLHVSYLGYFQQRIYAFLVMRTYPSVERVTLREYYPLVREARIAVVPRSALEHIERELADLASYLDRALVDGSASKLWKPSPGLHCAYCTRPTSCPIDPEARTAQNGLTSWEQVTQAAAEFVVANEARKDLREALKLWHDMTGTPIPVKSAKGRYELRWGYDSAGKRKFGLHVPEKSDRGTRDPNITAAFKAASAQRRKVKA